MPTRREPRPGLRGFGKRGAGSDPSALAPGLLVAAPSMSCPFFHHTVVMLVEHDDHGAFGFVINRPAETPVTSLLEGLEIDDLASELSGEVWVGGPVAPDTGWVLFDPQTGSAGSAQTVELDPRVSLTASRAFLERLARGRGPSRYALLLGYAGWGPGQLEDEIREGSWLWTALDATVVFDRPANERWQAAFETLGIDPSRVVGSIASA